MTCADDFLFGIFCGLFVGAFMMLTVVLITIRSRALK